MIERPAPAAEGRDLDTSWPVLPWCTWQPTIDTVHLWTQIVGKVRIALAPPRNHWWHVTLAATPRGLTTGGIRRQLQIDFDFVDVRLVPIRIRGSGPRNPLAVVTGGRS